MSKNVKRVFVLAVVLGVIMGTQATAFAAAPDPAVGSNGEFLCPIVGDGVTNADSNNGDNGVSTIGPAPGVSLLPGGNQAGTNANLNALNDLPPNDPDAGPGDGNSGFGAIWPTGGA